MNLLLEALAWIVDPVQWSGSNAIPVRVAEHLGVTALVLAIAAVIALPAGMVIGHTGRGRSLAVALSGGLRALPTLGLLTLVGLWVGIGLGAPVVALVILAIPSLLAGAYAGFESVDRSTIDGARSIGMTELQIVRRVEVPLGLGVLMGGVRAAALQVIATATLAAYVADLGLGRYLFAGLRTRNYDEMLGGSLLVAVLALVVDGLFALIQRRSVPASLRSSRVRRASAPRTRNPRVVTPPGTPAPHHERTAAREEAS